MVAASCGRRVRAQGEVHAGLGGAASQASRAGKAQRVGASRARRQGAHARYGRYPAGEAHPCACKGCAQERSSPCFPWIPQALFRLSPAHGHPYRASSPPPSPSRAPALRPAGRRRSSRAGSPPARPPPGPCCPAPPRDRSGWAADSGWRAEGGVRGEGWRHRQVRGRFRGESSVSARKRPEQWTGRG
jgi:hypothetical protein